MDKGPTGTPGIEEQHQLPHGCALPPVLSSQTVLPDGRISRGGHQQLDHARADRGAAVQVHLPRCLG